ncbi:MAG: DUF4827 domain-containing protein [Tannerellaceae bacterium]|jgi:hypothetical protein|nr:DUF4827 domain-containing protein [Tannerellaceae bacterium]
MKKGFNIGLVLCVVLCVLSCNNNPQYSDMLDAQERAINRLIDENDIEILDAYPANGVFKDNQFIILDNGVYLNVIDSGNGNRAQAGSTSVFCRFFVKCLIEWQYMDTTTVDYFRNGTEPITYVYGASSPLYNNNTASFFSTLLFSGLEYVGDSSEVKLIIPFHLNGNNSTFLQAGVPLYFSKVRYRFDPK